eukprot:scaffold82889_cov48-Phaeocystis_antarctica.AAC.1
MHHASSLDSADVIKIPQMLSMNPRITSPHIPQIPQSSADLADYSAVGASCVRIGQTCIVIAI